MRKRKEYRLTEEAVDVINMTKAKMNLLTGSDALCYIVEQYARMEGRMLSDTELNKAGTHPSHIDTCREEYCSDDGCGEYHALCSQRRLPDESIRCDHA